MLISSVPFALNFFTVINSLRQDYTVEITFYWVQSGERFIYGHEPTRISNIIELYTCTLKKEQSKALPTMYTQALLTA